ncbi:hypothetical protein, partial [Mycobacterium tuberculosis]|uniref:hypothetical protein n=1 Tax=Mycobacterium tuberculosis TaxID=1773 RepID=UPI001BA949F0
VLVAALGLIVALAMALLMPAVGKARTAKAKAATHGGGRGGFNLLLAIGVLDTAVRMGFLTFLPFLLQAKGASLPTSGIALA